MGANIYPDIAVASTKHYPWGSLEIAQSIYGRFGFEPNCADNATPVQDCDDSLRTAIAIVSSTDVSPQRSSSSPANDVVVRSSFGYGEPSGKLGIVIEAGLELDADALRSAASYHIYKLAITAITRQIDHNNEAQVRSWSRHRRLRNALGSSLTAHVAALSLGPFNPTAAMLASGLIGGYGLVEGRYLANCDKTTAAGRQDLLKGATRQRAVTFADRMSCDVLYDLQG